MIPELGVPSIRIFEIWEKNEEIVPISPSGLKVESQYYIQGISGSYKDCYVRETVLKMLLEAEKNLPDGLKLKIYDGYRPISVQQRLWNFYRQQVKNDNPTFSDEEIDFKTSFFVSKPSYDINQPSLHNTGGAVDLTLITDNGYELNMGTLFNDFTDRAWTNHFEKYENNKDVRENRRILYKSMIDAGFTNLPSEWWHYDYGTKFWAYFKDTDALYKGVLDINFPDRFPLV